MKSPRVRLHELMRKSETAWKVGYILVEIQREEAVRACPDHAEPCRKLSKCPEGVLPGLQSCGGPEVGRRCATLEWK